MKARFLAVAVAIVAVAAMALPAMATMKTTPHDLSYTLNNYYDTGNNGEICIWCHTPHAANNDAWTTGNNIPLWNKADSNQVGYVQYGNTVAGTAVGLPSGVSRACLSCHDGVNAINSQILSMDNPDEMNSAATGTLVAFSKADAVLNIPAGTPAVMANTMATDLGTDMTRQHPVSVVYTTGKASLKDPTANSFLVSVGTTTFVNNALFGTGANRTVECASCHDPHSAAGDTTRIGTTAGDLFLMVDNAGSQLCLSCHDK